MHLTAHQQIGPFIIGHSQVSVLDTPSACKTTSSLLRLASDVQASVAAPERTKHVLIVESLH